MTYLLNTPDKMINASLKEIYEDINYVVIEMQGISQKFSLVVNTDCDTLIYLPHVPDSGPYNGLVRYAGTKQDWAAWNLAGLNGREILALQTELSRRLVSVVHNEILAELS